MAKQTSADLPTQCQHKSQCDRDATWGTYRFRPGQTDVDLNMPARVLCGRHKPQLHYLHWLRNVKLRRFP